MGRSVGRFCTGLVVLLLLLLGRAAVAEAPTLRLSDAGRQHLKRFELLEDGPGELGFEQVREVPDGRWRHLEDVEPVLGYTTSPHWVRFSVDNPRDTTAQRILVVGYAPLDDARLFRPTTGGGWKRAVAGDRYPFSKREVDFRDPAFELAVPPGRHTYYLRIQGTGVIAFPLSVWKPAALLRFDRESHLAFGLFYGLLIAMATYNLVLFLFLFDRLYLLYVAFFLSIVLFQLGESGLSHRYLWPEQPWWAHRSSLISLGIAHATGMLFIRDFLRTWKHLPRLDPVLLGVAVLGASPAVLSIVHYPSGARVAVVASVLEVSLGIVAGVGVVRQGRRAGRYFLGAWGAALVGTLLHAFMTTGWVPPSPVTEYGVQLGVAVAAILLAVGLADRINVLKREKDRAEAASGLDSLTGIPNRRAFERRLEDDWTRAKRREEPIAVLLVDVDHFKAFNDHFGHLAGDACLRSIAQALAGEARGGMDRVARYGGEEFIVLANDTDRNGAMALGERLRRCILHLGISHVRPDGLEHVSVSVGVAVEEAPTSNDSFWDLLRSADAALYSAKAAGRNRVVSAHDEPPAEPRSDAPAPPSSEARASWTEA